MVSAVSSQTVNHPRSVQPFYADGEQIGFVHGFRNYPQMISPQIKKYPVESRDGARSRISVFRNPDKHAPVIIIKPAMGARANFYAPFAQSFVARGVHVVTADLRGHGESAIRPSREIDFGYDEMVRYDWPAVILRVRTLFPFSRRWICAP